MADPIIKSTGFYETIAPLVANDGVITQEESLRILDAVRGGGGIAPRELAQAKILKQRLYDVLIAHGMWPRQAAAQRKLDSATTTAQKAAALLELAAANLEVRLLAARNQEAVDSVVALVEQQYGEQWWVHSWVLGVVFGGDPSRPVPDAGLDANGKPIR